MKEYEKLRNIKKVTHMINLIGPFIPFIVVFIAMGANTPIPADEKDSWSGMMIIAFVCIFLLIKPLSSWNKRWWSRLDSYCQENIIIPMLVEKNLVIKRIAANEQIEERFISKLFRKLDSSDRKKKYTDFNFAGGSWLLEGNYKKTDFLFSNVSLYTKGSRGAEIRGFYGCFMVIFMNYQNKCTEEEYQSRLGWERIGGDFYIQRGKCYCSVEDGILYIGLDCLRNLFQPKGDYETYVKKCQEDVALLIRLLDAFEPESEAQ